MNQTVNVKRKGNGCAMFRRLRRNANAQLFTEPFAQIQTNARGLLNQTTILTGKSLFKDTGQIGRSNPDSIIAEYPMQTVMRFSRFNGQNGNKKAVTKQRSEERRVGKECRL